MTKNRNLFLLVLSFFLFSISNAQQNDAELWTGASINKRIAKNILGKYEQQLRLNDNISKVKNVFSELGLSMDCNKHIKISGYYRLSNRELDNGTNAMGHRFHGDIRVRYKKKPIIFSVRTRMQTENRTKLNGKERSLHNRNRFKIQLDLDRRISPFIASEVYYDLSGNHFNKVRYTTGLDIDLKNRMGAKIFYRLQREFNIANPTYSYIVGVGYSYRLRGRLLKNNKGQE